jgi:hypothetical protein
VTCGCIDTTANLLLHFELNNKESDMSRIDDILAKQKALDEELKLAKQEERDKELAVIKEKIKFFGFKTSDFKGVLATRKKRTTSKTVKK